MPGTVRVTVLETVDLPGNGGKKFYVKVSIGDRSFSTKAHSSHGTSGSVSIKPFNSDHSFPVLNLTDPLVITLIELRTETPVGRAVIPVPSIVEKGIRDEILPLSNGGRIRVKSSFSLSEEEKRKLAQMRLNSMKKRQAAEKAKNQQGSAPDPPQASVSPQTSSLEGSLPPNLTPSAIPKLPVPSPVPEPAPETETGPTSKPHLSYADSVRGSVPAEQAPEALVPTLPPTPVPPEPVPTPEPVSAPESVPAPDPVAPAEPIPETEPEPQPQVLEKPPEPVISEPITPEPTPVPAPAPVPVFLPEPAPAPAFEFTAKAEPPPEVENEVAVMDGVEYAAEEETISPAKLEERDRKQDEVISEFKKTIARRVAIGKRIAPPVTSAIAEIVGEATDKFMRPLNRVPSVKKSAKPERKTSFGFNPANKDSPSQQDAVQTRIPSVKKDVFVEPEVEPPHGTKRARSFASTLAGSEAEPKKEFKLDSSPAIISQPEPTPQPPPVVATPSLNVEPLEKPQPPLDSHSKPKVIPRSLPEPIPQPPPEPKPAPPPEPTVESGSEEGESEVEESDASSETEEREAPRPFGGFLKQVVGGLIVAVTVAVLWPKKKVYVVKKGDHLCGIIPREYYKSHSRFYKLNPNIRDADHIYEGQELILP